MEISYSELKNKEVINVSDGRKLGHIIDILFDGVNGLVKGVVVPGDKKIFRKTEDIFVPLSKVKKIGDDVILVVLQNARNMSYASQNSFSNAMQYANGFENNMNYYSNGQSDAGKRSFVRYKRIDKKKYK